MFALVIHYVRRRRRLAMQRYVESGLGPDHTIATAPRVADMQMKVAPIRDPEIMEVISNFGFILEHVKKLPPHQRPEKISHLISQAEAATKVFLTRHSNPRAKTDYLARLGELAEALMTPQTPLT
ncbi:MAG: hypothetical protein ABJL99_18490 [Aliishimia sp.]